MRQQTIFSAGSLIKSNDDPTRGKIGFVTGIDRVFFEDNEVRIAVTVAQIDTENEIFYVTWPFFEVIKQ